MKTLLKAIEKRTSIPVLQCVLVHDGKIATTDMDVWVYDSKTMDIEDGLYNKHGFDKGIYTKDMSNSAINDFPEPLNFGKEICEYYFSEKDMKDFEWLCNAISTEETRYYLNGVCFDDKNIVATDGHRMHILSVRDLPNKEKTVKFERKILPRKTCDLMVMFWKEKKPETIIVKMFEYGFEISATGTEAKIFSKHVDGTFPDYSRVIPKNRTKHIVFDLEKLRPTLKECCIRAKQEGNKVAVIKFNKNQAEFYRQKKEIDFPIDIEIGFNARYMQEIQSGKLYYTDGSTAVLIDNVKNKTKAVLMPMRV